MAAPAAAATALLAAAAAVYVFHRGSDKPTPAGDVPPDTYVFKKLQRAVVKDVVESGFFSAYLPEQLAGGNFFIVATPERGNTPVPSADCQIFATDPGPVVINGTTCILLDIRECE